MIMQDLKESGRFTESEQAISQYILLHYQDVLNMTARELAEAAFVSAPTVVRLCKKLGFSSYTAFKVQLSKETTDEYIRMTHVDYDVPFQPGATDQDLVEGMASLAISSIVHSREHFDYSAMRKVCEFLQEKKFIDVYATGHSMNGAQEFIEKMCHIGYVVTAISSSDLRRSRVYSTTREQAVIVISYSGLNNGLIPILPMLKQQSAGVIVITGNHTSPMLEYAGQALFIDSEENLRQSQKTDTFGALYSLHYLLDCLFAMIFSEHYDENLQRAHRISQTQPMFQDNAGKSRPRGSHSNHQGKN